MDYNKYFLSDNKPVINPKRLKSIVRNALIEDIGSGDITTKIIIPNNKRITAKIIAKESFFICGLAVAEKVFKAVDPSLKFQAKVKEGNAIKAKEVICLISGKARGILTAERVALNLLSFMSAIATKTNVFVKEVKPYKTKITDTRKTIAGLRELQKYAVRVGGGFNHRMKLDEMILIKDNHLKVISKCHPRESGDLKNQIPVPSLNPAGTSFTGMKGYKIEIEAQNMNEFIHALNLMPDVIMLDNMSVAEIKEAVKLRNNTKFPPNQPLTKLEASGGISLNNIKNYAATGVDLISVGELTSSIKSVDMSLEIV